MWTIPSHSICKPSLRTTCELLRNKTGGSCTGMHFYGCFCTCGRVAIQCYEQNRPLRLIFVHDSPGGHRRRATARRGGYEQAGSGGLGPSGPPPRHARCQRGSPPEVSGVTGADEGSEGKVAGGVAPLGHGKREGPAGDKFPRSGDAGNGGRVRSERQRTEPPGHLSLREGRRADGTDGATAGEPK